MSGIVGYIGYQVASPVLMQGLKKLEYRGYDSAGIILLEDNNIDIIKADGELTSLEKKIKGQPHNSTVGIGYTRWAASGCPSDDDARPHTAFSAGFAVVHSGIIENCHTLWRMLQEKGHVLRSESDSEVLACLLEHYYRGNLEEAVKSAVNDLKGSYALIAMCSQEKGKLVCACQDSPLFVGLGEGGNFIASELPALLTHSSDVYILEEGEMAAVTTGEVAVYNSRGKISKAPVRIEYNASLAEKEGYDHFMLKEIMEQPRAVRDTLRGRFLPDGTVTLGDLGLSAADMRSLEKIVIVACGTSYHAGMMGKYILEKILRLSVEVDLASEFRYRDPLLTDKTLVVVISQSGETADTLAALRLARQEKTKTLAITNVVGSSIAREADSVLYTWAGPEISVASTKAYLTQLIALYLITFQLAAARKAVDESTLKELGLGLQTLPAKIEEVLAKKNKIKKLGHQIAEWENVFYVGRNIDYTVALEGALKLKETSYIHAAALPTGELKHGTLALVTEGKPFVVLATRQHVLEKNINSIKELKAQGAYVIAISFEEDREALQEADQVFGLPRVPDILAPVLSALPLQLMAYYAAVKRNCPVDQPRNLTKAVTEE